MGLSFFTVLVLDDHRSHYVAYVMINYSRLWAPIHNTWQQVNTVSNTSMEMHHHLWLLHMIFKNIGYFRSSLTSSTDIASYYFCMWGSKYVVICTMHLPIIVKYGTLSNKLIFETSILRKYLPLENTIYTDEEASLHKNALSLQRLHLFSPSSHNAIYIYEQKLRMKTSITFWYTHLITEIEESIR